MDGSNIVSQDIMDGVRQSALLADVSLSMWSGERSDKNLLKKIKTDAGASGDIGRMVKYLLAGADQELKDVKSAFTAVRTEHYAMTLPWVSDPHAERQRGPRLLPNALYDEYLKRLATARHAAVQALDHFISVYPARVLTARTNLAALADAVYPGAEEVRAAFGIKVELEPIPEGAGFKGLPQQTIQRLTVLLNRKHQAMAAGAAQALWAAVHDRVGHMSEILADPDARFKASTVERVRELLTLLPGWNLMGDERVTEVVEDLRNIMDGVDSTILRDNQTVRSNVASRSQQVIDKLRAWQV